MKQFTFLGLALISSLLLSNAPHETTPSLIQHKLLQQKLATLTERGLTHRIVENAECTTCGTGRWLEAIDPRTGLTYKFPLDPLLTPRAQTHPGLPTLTIDLRTLDTNFYNWRFHYVSNIPTTAAWGFPLQVRDFDGNGRVEAYGVRQTQSDRTTCVHELTMAGSWSLRYEYPSYYGTIDKMGDIDGNGLSEVYASYGDSLFFFEQAALDSIPTGHKFHHRQWYQSASGIPNQVHDMTGDGTPEVLYRGSRPDTVSPPNIEKTFTMIYDSTINNLREMWSAQLPPDCYEQACAGAIATGDFDGDGKAEFATSNFAGNVYVVEHVAGDSFAVTWTTNLSVAGRATAGDVDGNGLNEFFVGGTQVEVDGYVHLRAYAFERTGDNAFQPVFAFDIFPAGMFFVDLYQTADVDGDNVLEFILSFAGGIMVIKGAGEHNYQLFYHRSVSSLDGISAWRIDTTGAAHLFVSRSIGSQQIISQTDVYSLDSSLVVGVPAENRLPSSVQLFQNYPNPFNPTTTFSFTLPHSADVSLVVCNVLGQEIAGVAHGYRDAGNHTVVWDAANHPSGMYFARLTVKGDNGKKVSSKVIKLLLMK